MKKCAAQLFLFAVTLFLLAGLAKTVWFPEEINSYENRSAAQIDSPTLEGFLSASFQTSMEHALTDQVNGAQNMKRAYNTIHSAFLKETLQEVSAATTNRYVSYLGLQLFGSKNITYPTYIFSDLTDRLDAKIDNYNAIFAKHPELTFCVYFIEKDTDIDFETNEKVGASDYVLDRLTLPAQQKTIYRVNSFEEFRTWFYQTDHHWNNRGSYRAYLQIMELLGKTDLLTARGEVRVSDRFSGSKAKTSGAADVFYEDFMAYRFPYPAMDMEIDEKPAPDYGQQEAYLAGTVTDPISYGGFYGWDNGEVSFHTKDGQSGNLLVIGESYDNAVLKLLASSYQNTYGIDLRHYEKEMGHPFQLGTFAQEHQIDTVLLMGNVDYFLMPEFLLED